MTVYYSENTKKRDFSLMIRPYSAIPPKHFWASQPQCSRSCKSRWQVPSLSHTEEGQKRWLLSCILLCPTCKMNCNFVTLGIPKECFIYHLSTTRSLFWSDSRVERKLNCLKNMTFITGALLAWYLSFLFTNSAKYQLLREEMFCVCNAK